MYTHVSTVVQFSLTMLRPKLFQPSYTLFVQFAHEKDRLKIGENNSSKQQKLCFKQLEPITSFEESFSNQMNEG